MDSQFFTSSFSQTKALGELLAGEIIKTRLSKNARVIGLIGELGSGKTTFLQGFAKGLGINQRITSPTFVIMHRIKNFYHLDCYRLGGARDVLGLGFKKLITDPQNIVAIEWADKIAGILPKTTIWLKFESVSPKKRKIVVKYGHGR